MRSSSRPASGLAVFAAAAAMVAAVACGSPDAGSSDAASSPASQEPADRGVFPPTPTVVPLFSQDPPAVQPDNFVADGAAIEGIVEWINSPPLTLEGEASSGAVLIDFWTYTCVNCIRTFPFLRALYDRYESAGLTIIGVHSPEFDFERVPENVRAAVERNGLRYPIAVDSDRVTWDLFGNRFWPSTYLFDGDGRLVYRHFGEGGYLETEAAVREALAGSGRDLGGVARLDVATVARAPDSFTVTREIYTGYGKVYELGGVFAAQGLYYEEPDSTAVYEDAGLRRNGQFELQGLWRNEKDGVVHARSTSGAEDYVVLPFFGTSVNAVISPLEPGRSLEIELDGFPVGTGQEGADVVHTPNGRSLVPLTEARMYRLVELNEFGRHELKVRVRGGGVKIHDFTFGIYETGP